MLHILTFTLSRNIKLRLFLFALYLFLSQCNIQIGVLNLPSSSDIAIGAPYENYGEGAVYIYFGSETGIVQPYVQKITPSDLPAELPMLSRPVNHTFGYSLSGGLDLDGNGYPELLVGAFETDSIIAFR